MDKIDCEDYNEDATDKGERKDEMDNGEDWLRGKGMCGSGNEDGY